MFDRLSYKKIICNRIHVAVAFIVKMLHKVTLETNYNVRTI